MTQANRRESSENYGDFMLKLAENLGCRPRSSTAGRYTGYCPFHGGATASRDLTLDLTQGRFRCVTCNINDSASGFAARVWRMGRRDAQALIESQAAPQAERPVGVAASIQRQNTAVLTRGMAHYRDNLHYSVEAAWYLGALGITAEQAAGIGLGWCPRDSAPDTINALRLDGVTEEEVRATTLFTRRGGEQMAGCIVVPDLDAAGGVIWMAGIAPELPPAGQAWNGDPPAARFLQGWRPFMLYLRRRGARPRRTYVTDDCRLALRLNAANRAVACVLGRREPEGVARHVSQLNSTEVAILYQDAATADAIMSELTDTRHVAKENVLTGDPALIISILNDRSARLPQLLAESEPEPEPGGA